MSNNKFTKGKWNWEYASGDNLAKLVNENGYEVCNFGNNYDYYPTEGEEPNKYDKLLISKAPEMISELKETITDLNILKFQIMDAVKTNHLFEGMPELIEKWIERKKDLIKEATEL